MLQTMRLKLFFAIHLPLFKKNQTNPNFITRAPQNLTCKNVISSSSVCSKQRSGTFQCFNQIRGIFLRLKRLSLEQSNNRGLEGEAETETLTNIILCNSVVQTFMTSHFSDGNPSAGREPWLPQPRKGTPREETAESGRLF